MNIVSSKVVAFRGNQTTNSQHSWMEGVAKVTDPPVRLSNFNINRLRSSFKKNENREENLQPRRVSGIKLTMQKKRKTSRT